MFVLPILCTCLGRCSQVEQYEALHEVLMTGFVPVFAHSVDSAVGYVDIEPLRAHLTEDPTAPHTHSSNQFDEQEPQPSVRDIFVDHRSCSNEDIAANCHPTNNRTVGFKGCSLTNKRVPILILA